MDIIIYSFFIVAGLSGLSYYAVKKRFARMLKEEQEKTFSIRNSVMQLAAEKQRLESALKEKTQQIASIESHISSEESMATSLSTEVLTKDKQIQSLSAQLHHETQQRTNLEQELAAIEHRLSEFKSKITTEESKTMSLHSDVSAKEQQIRSLSEQLQQETAQRTELEQELVTIERTLTEFKSLVSEEETKASSLSSDVSSKEQEIRSLSAELRQQLDERTNIERILSEKERDAAQLASQISQEEAQRSALANELSAKEQQFQSTLNQQTMELQQVNDKLQHEIGLRTTIEQRSQESIRELQHQIEQLQSELSSTRSMNESLNSSREMLTEEFRVKEGQYRQKLSEAELYLSATKHDLETTAALLQEQTNERVATEHALQESKQKLYAVICDLEQKVNGQSNAISALQSELTQKSNELNLAEQSIYNVLRLVPIPVFVVNENGICEYCNAPLEELVGYGMNELSDKHFARLFPADERAFYEEQWNNTDNRSEQFRGETRIVAATNDTISASVNFVDIQTNGDAKKYVGFILDRTTEKDAKKHYATAKEREQELLDLKSRFIGMVSNQLRTSLVTIATNTELLERFVEKWGAERRYHSFLRINESIRQMLELVRDVAFTTQATTEQYTLNISAVNLESMLQKSAAELTADLESHHHFILSVQGNISSVPCDEKLLQTIVSQLLSNAFKYSRDNTEVNVHIEHSNASCIMKIADQGIGIPAAEQKHLFSTFFRASNVSNIYGTGLGLTIAQQCVQMHGGSISIESELHKGTTVTVTLPVR